MCYSAMTYFYCCETVEQHQASLSFSIKITQHWYIHHRNDVAATLLHNDIHAYVGASSANLHWDDDDGETIQEIEVFQLSLSCFLIQNQEEKTTTHLPILV